MTERITNKKREALIVGNRFSELVPDERAELPLLTALLADPSTWAEPSAGLEDSIVHAVMNDEPSEATVTAIGDRRRPTRRRNRIIVRATAAAVAASVAIILGSVVASSGGTSPDFTAALAPTGLAPDAQGSAQVVHNKGGFRIVLDATGLQRLPDGAYYEAWLKDAAGTLVPIGTFSSSDQYIALWSGVSPATFTTLTVTIESPDNNQTSSGQVVLVGDVRVPNDEPPAQGRNVIGATASPSG
jgi:hypothetical protein